MPPRPDVSEKLIHFTGGRNHDEAFQNLRSIMDDGFIRGSDHLIRGQFTCVCFTEAPLAALSTGFVNLQEFSRYRPFGVMYDKSFVYSRGGRPAIYGADAEYDGLSESCKWRHMRYEPDGNPPVDFTWEREWRIQIHQMPVEPQIAHIVVPSLAWAERILQVYDEGQDYLIRSYAQSLGDDLAEQYREDFPWHFAHLE